MAKYLSGVDKNKIVVNQSTGEVEEVRVFRKVSAEDFIMLYFMSDEVLMSLTGFQWKLLYQCWKHCSINPEGEEEGNIINNTPYFKMLLKAAGIKASSSTINAEMSKLAKRNILISKGFGVYIMNPIYFFKGRLTDRTRLIMKMVNNEMLKKEDVKDLNNLL